MAKVFLADSHYSQPIRAPFWRQIAYPQEGLLVKSTLLILCVTDFIIISSRK
jgi:hypothetical protein